MKKNILIICFTFVLLGLLSCEKDANTNTLADSRSRSQKNASDLKKALHGAPDGWVMMVKSNLTDLVASPVVMKFDTTTNKIDITTVHGITDTTAAYFQISTHTGSPFLSFSTGSFITSLFRVGKVASEVTDHVFKLVSISADTIEIKGYRSGSVYSPEGGVTYKLFKRPANWTWANRERIFDLSTAEGSRGIFGGSANLKLNYSNGLPVFPDSLLIEISPVPPEARKAIASFHSFSDVSARGLQPIYNFIVANYGPITGNDLNEDVFCTLGHNSVSLMPIQHPFLKPGALRLIGLLKTTYLVVRSVVRSNASVELHLVAYDKDGKEVITGMYKVN